MPALADSVHVRFQTHAVGFQEKEIRASLDLLEAQRPHRVKILRMMTALFRPVFLKVGITPSVGVRKDQGR